MKRLLKSRKALSPVVAAIILIAVTVAVSIAVAAWMGALTFTFMQTEEVKITDLYFPTGTIRVTAKNTGTAPVTITQCWINDVEQPITQFTVEANSQYLLNLTYTWTPGYNYAVKLISTQGNTFLRQETAPSS